ncbi:MAG: acylneuraminate cytidylyltransferase family protein [Gammaproteobacteria bacterium]|nr:acylneuraminate cytidylyltransferase family protein [Gammaproteobacteria bacterium]
MSCKYLAIIPARAGSKRLPNKNVLSLAKKPMVEWSIAAAVAAQQSLDIDVVVTSDDERVLEIARRFPEVSTIVRNPALCTDEASSMDVVFDALTQREQAGRVYEALILLQPTSPLRTSEDITQSIALFESKNAQAVISVCQCEHSPLWTNTLPADGAMSDFMPQQVMGKRSQDLPAYYRLNGAIYIANCQTLRETNTFFNLPNSFAYKMPAEYSVDVDSAIDLALAEVLINQREGKN